jgi:hypothetical protein
MMLGLRGLLLWMDNWLKRPFLCRGKGKGRRPKRGGLLAAQHSRPPQNGRQQLQASERHKGMPVVEEEEAGARLQVLEGKWWSGYGPLADDGHDPWPFLNGHVMI